MFGSRTWAKSLVVVGALVLGSTVSRSAVAASLELDPTWGVNGISYTRIVDEPHSSTNESSRILLQPDSKVVAFGTRIEWDDNGSPKYSLSLARYKPNGSLDEGFGNGGLLTVPRAPSATDEQYPDAVLTSDGKIVLASLVRCGGKNCIGLTRLNATGTVDTSFGTSGHVLRLSEQWLDRLMLQSDGKLLLWADDEIVRWNADGSIDTSFGGGGAISLSSADINSSKSSAAMQADGKIVVAEAVSPTEAEAARVVLHRFNGDGTYDHAFGGSMVFSSPVVALFDATHVAARPDGKLAVAVRGQEMFDVYANYVAQFNADGSPDTSSSVEASATHPIYPRSLTAQSDNRVFYGGSQDFALLLRISADGSIQDTWKSAECSSVGSTIVANGRIYVGCGTSDGFKVASLRGDSAPLDGGTDAAVDASGPNTPSDGSGNATKDAAAAAAPGTTETYGGGGCSVAPSTTPWASLGSLACTALALLARRTQRRRASN